MSSIAAPDRWYGGGRLGGLRRFALAISVLNLLGHTVLGFEQSWAQPLAALAAAYGTEMLLEAIGARVAGRRPKYAGGWRARMDFLLPAHISGLAVSMLLYTNERVEPTIFASVVAIASKLLVRVPVGNSWRHPLNPSNVGLTATLLLFPAVGQVAPYQFTEELAGAGDWLLPCVIVLSGSFLNARFTHRVPLILAWFGGFAAQALARSLVHSTPVTAALVPMTGVAFCLFSFYMITDPATSPESSGGQVAFGLAVAAAYGTLMTVHVVYGLFVALTTVCAVRGVLLVVLAGAARRGATTGRAPLPPAVVVPVGVSLVRVVPSAALIPRERAARAEVDGR